MSATPSHQPSAVAASLMPVKALGNVLVLCAIAVVIFAAFVLVGLDGWTYYTTPAAVRGYTSAHQVLRPAGRVGHLFGVGGFVLMLVPIAYSVRKKVRRFRDAGSLKTWLEVHVFCGIFGPVLVTFHTAFKFNGIVSAAYWSMVVVVLSGFVGRYLFVRIPRSIRGHELTQAELDERALQLSRELSAAALPEKLLADIEAFERRVAPPHGAPSFAVLFLGEISMLREIRRFRRMVEQRAVAAELHHNVIEVAAERAMLVRRIAYLKKTKTLFDLWHVFHMPLVYIMFVIVLMHVAVTMYMGYVPFMD